MEDERPAPPRPRNIGFATTWAIAIGFSCVVVGQLAEEFVGIPPTRSADKGAAPPQFSAIDYSTTGGIKRQPPSPCGPRADGP